MAREPLAAKPQAAKSRTAKARQARNEDRQSQVAVPLPDREAQSSGGRHVRTGSCKSRYPRRRRPRDMPAPQTEQPLRRHEVHRKPSPPGTAEGHRHSAPRPQCHSADRKPRSPPIHMPDPSLWRWCRSRRRYDRPVPRKRRPMDFATILKPLLDYELSASDAANLKEAIRRGYQRGRAGIASR